MRLASTLLFDDFTIEFFAYGISADGNSALLKFSTSDGNPCFVLYAGTINGYSLPTGSNPIGKWNHYAFVKSSGSLSCYFNGTKIGSNSCTGHIGTICIGGNDVDYGGGYYRCYLDNFVISDTARYTDTFTPPESPVGAYRSLMYLKDKEVWGMKE